MPAKFQLQLRHKLGGWLLVVAIVSACILCLASAQDTNPFSTNGVQKVGTQDKPVAPDNGFRTTCEFPILAKAFIVGSLGACAFLLAVYSGFISRQSRTLILQYLVKDEKIRPVLVILFGAFGGIVAAVFQWAQPQIFAPIQALVLGATWPSVVMRFMSGDGNSGPLQPIIDSLDTPTRSFPIPKGGRSAGDALVLIKPKQP